MVYENTPAPNHFGEIVCWLGIYVFVVSSFSLTNALIGLISPIGIIIILLFITCILKRENYYNKRYGKYPAYKKYKKDTSLLIL